MTVLVAQQKNKTANKIISYLATTAKEQDDGALIADPEDFNADRQKSLTEL